MSNRQEDDQILEVVFHSATDLPKPPLSFKAAKPYVMAGIISPNTEPNWEKTITDEKGGENPVWDFLILFPLSQQKLHMARNFNLICKIMHSGTALGDREIGHVKVRLPILLAGAAAGENISYPVVSSGEERGRIVMSHKLLTTTVPTPPPPPPMGVQDPNQNTSLEFLIPNSLSQDHNQILELIFHRAIDLPHPLFNHKGRPYVMAAIVGLDTEPDWVKTNTDEKGGENPVWDYVIELPLDQEKVRKARNFSLICKIMHSGKNLGNREIGLVKVRLQDFLGTGENIHYPVVVSSGGVEKGTIVISHRLVDGNGSPPTGTEDPNRGAGGGGMTGRIKLAATATAVVASVCGAVAEFT